MCAKSTIHRYRYGVCCLFKLELNLKLCAKPEASMAPRSTVTGRAGADIITHPHRTSNLSRLRTVPNTTRSDRTSASFPLSLASSSVDDIKLPAIVHNGLPIRESSLHIMQHGRPISNSPRISTTRYPACQRHLHGTLITRRQRRIGNF